MPSVELLLSRDGFEIFRIREFARTDVAYGCHVGALKPLELKSMHIRFSNTKLRSQLRFKY
jgi:hypothetical protein